MKPSSNLAANANCQWCAAAEAAAKVCERDVDWAEFCSDPDINWKGYDENYPWSLCSKPCGAKEVEIFAGMAVERHCADGGLKRYLTGILAARVIAASIRQEVKAACPLCGTPKTAAESFTPDAPPSASTAGPSTGVLHPRD